MLLKTSVFDISNFPFRPGVRKSCSKYGAIHSPAIGDLEFIYGAAKILWLFKKMILTGKPPIPYEDILEHIAVVETGQMAQKKGQRVYLKDIMRH